MENDLISRSALLAEMELDEPDSVDENNQEIKWMRNEWRHWKKKIKRFPAVDAVVLPCKIGDSVWIIRNYKGVEHPQEGIVNEMSYTKDMRLMIAVRHIARGEWGKEVFATQEEAEAAIGERKENE